MIHLYLDIDGVLNAYDRLEHTPSDWPSGYRPIIAGGYILIVADDCVARLNALIAEHGIVPHWLTSWEKTAQEAGPMIGLKGSESWPWFEARGFTQRAWTKHTSIRDHLEQTQPELAFWLDDDLAHVRTAREWADQHPGLHAYAPDPTHGITPAILDDIERAIKAHAARGPYEGGKATLIAEHEATERG
jgi:hypothetical protein